MKKIYSGLLLFSMVNIAFAQWSPTAMTGQKLRKEVEAKQFYSLDIAALRSQLTTTKKAGKGVKGTIVSLPTLGGKLEKFQVFSAPVLSESLASKYQLGSYVGVGVDDQSKWVRFSISPTDFQSMVFSNGKYEFIEPQNSNKSVYAVFPKSKKTESNAAFECGIDEKFLEKQQLKNLASKNISNNNENVALRNSGQKFRTYRLAISTTGEYTNHFGSVAGALAAINATMTRVNGIFEKDFGVQLIVQDFPQLIFTDATTDPYSDPNLGVDGFLWSGELQRTLTATIGNDAYDMGHLFGESGGGGFAGDIGNVCRNPHSDTDDESKGTGFTSPGTGAPQGDSFDIDFVAHEMGHQLGAWHTFSHLIEGGSEAQMEPGSGSTIMSYAGITKTADVQNQSDPYFHAISIKQVQDYLSTQSCGTITTVANTSPVISSLVNKTIPKGTAFVLTAQASDKENNPLTYVWEQYDNTTTAIANVTLNTSRGAKFRSILPTTSPTRYFPKLANILNGNLSSRTDWESVSNIARDLNFAITVRDNNPDVLQQQTTTEYVKVTVGADGPFKLNTTKVLKNGVSNIEWDVVNTMSAPYNVTSVKIDYSTDNGQNWTILSNETPNDGSELLSFANVTVGSTIHIRVSAIDNIFYAVSKATVENLQSCDGSAPLGLTASVIKGTEATLSWNNVEGATYSLQYKKASDTNWTTSSLTTNTTKLTGLSSESEYQVQIASICNGTQGAYSPVVNFNTVLSTIDPSKSKEVGIFPNPVIDILNVTNVSSKSLFKIFSLNGQLIKSGIIVDSSINVSQISKGVYILSISDDEKTSNIKFIKK